jgi:hypothetical protein
LNDTAKVFTMPPPSSSLDVFISYAREDRSTAERLAATLQAQGISVWWDREILGGAEFAEVIERELTRARVVLVLWSAQSVRSSFVRDESSRAFEASKLLPVRIEDVKVPLGFGQIHTLDLIDWNGDDGAPALAELLAHVRRHLQGEVSPVPPPVPGPIRPNRRRTLVVAGVAAGVVAGAGGWIGWQQWFGRDTDLARTLTGEGVEKFEKQLFDEARFKFNQAVAADDRFAPAYFYRAQVLIRAEAPQAAAADLARALELRAGLDDDLLGDAKRWLAEVSSGQADPAPVTRVAAAEVPSPEPAPASGAAAGASPSTGAPKPTSAVSASPDHAASSAAPPKSSAPGTVVQPGAVAKPAIAAKPIAQGPSPAGAATASPPAEAAAMRRLPLTGTAQARLKAAVDQMFSPSKDVRMAATTGLIVDVEAPSDATQLVVERALQVQRNGRPSDDASRSGVINALTLLQSAAPSTLALHAEDIRRLLESARANGAQTAELVTAVAAALDRAEKLQPLVYVQIASDAQRPLATTLAARLRAGGYRVPGFEVVGQKAPARTELRVQGRSDQGLARWMQKAIGEITGAPVEVKTLRNAKPKEDTFELWLDARLCAAADRRPPACTG